jgi:hypothetical protein
MSAIEIDDVMEFIVSRSSAGLHPRELGELFDRLIWTFADNGHGVLRVCRQWLEGDDRTRISAALWISEVFLFSERREMDEVLGRVESMFPDLSGRCREIVSAWEQQHGGD